MKTVEYQIQEGDVGDLLCVEATTAEVNVVTDEDDKRLTMIIICRIMSV